MTCHDSWCCLTALSGGKLANLWIRFIRTQGNVTGNNHVSKDYCKTKQSLPFWISFQRKAARDGGFFSNGGVNLIPVHIERHHESGLGLRLLNPFTYQANFNISKAGAKVPFAVKRCRRTLLTDFHFGLCVQVALKLCGPDKIVHTNNSGYGKQGEQTRQRSLTFSYLSTIHPEVCRIFFSIQEFHIVGVHQPLLTCMCMFLCEGVQEWQGFGLVPYGRMMIEAELHSGWQSKLLRGCWLNPVITAKENWSHKHAITTLHGPTMWIRGKPRFLASQAREKILSSPVGMRD